MSARQPCSCLPGGCPRRLLGFAQSHARCPAHLAAHCAHNSADAAGWLVRSGGLLGRTSFCPARSTCRAHIRVSHLSSWRHQLLAVFRSVWARPLRRLPLLLRPEQKGRGTLGGNGDNHHGILRAIGSQHPSNIRNLDRSPALLYICFHGEPAKAGGLIASVKSNIARQRQLLRWTAVGLRDRSGRRRSRGSGAGHLGIAAHPPAHQIRSGVALRESSTPVGGSRCRIEQVRHRGAVRDDGLAARARSQGFGRRWPGPHAPGPGQASARGDGVDRAGGRLGRFGSGDPGLCHRPW